MSFKMMSDQYITCFIWEEGLVGLKQGGSARKPQNYFVHVRKEDVERGKDIT